MAWEERWSLACGGMDGCVCVWSIQRPPKVQDDCAPSPQDGTLLVREARLKGHRGKLLEVSHLKGLLKRIISPDI